MRDIPASFVEKFNSTSGRQPMVVAAIWADRGVGDTISGSYRMNGRKDPARVGDANVNVDLGTAEATLGVGAPVAVNKNGTLLGVGLSLLHYFTVRDEYYMQGHGYFYGSTYVHVAWVPVVTSKITRKVLPFSATGSRFINELYLQLGNSGNQGVTVTFRFVDASTGKVVGRPVLKYLAPGAPVVSRLLTGFAAGVKKSKRYSLEIFYPPPPTDIVGVAYTTTINSRNVIVRGFSTTGIDANWRIPIVGGCLAIGGNEGYSSSGLLVRSLDVCAFGGAQPTGNGVVSVSDSVPTQTKLVVTAYATDSAAQYAAAGVAGWTKIGVIQSGQSVPPYRYWRFVCAFTANPLRDDSPRLQSISVNYEGTPVVIGTHAQTVEVTGTGNSYRLRASPAINKLSSVTSALDAKAKSVMIGKITLSLAPEPIVAQLLLKPIRAARVLIRVGYSDLTETVKFYEGNVRDLAYSRGEYILTIQDPLELADVSVPRNKWPSWVSTTTYISGQTVTYGNKSYLALSNTTGQAPTAFPLVWQDAGTVWQDIIYPAGTHLCDIVSDLLSNQINIPAERIDFASLDDVKAKFPGRVTTGRTLANPEQAIGMLSDLAWLLESYWTTRGGRMALIAEADATMTPDETITPDDIKAGGLEYRRGVAELKNECLILTQYIGAGAGNEQYTNAIAYVDANSVQNYAINAVHQFNDKWNVPSAELSAIATNFVNRWKDGRRIIRAECSMRMLAPETGDVVDLYSSQLPAADVTSIRAIVMQSDINWQAQTITLTLMEIN